MRINDSQLFFKLLEANVSINRIASFGYRRTKSHSVGLLKINFTAIYSRMKTCNVPLDFEA